MPDLDTILHSAIERLAPVPDDGIGELKLSRFRAPRIVPIGRAWRLGRVLLIMEIRDGLGSTEQLVRNRPLQATRARSC